MTHITRVQETRVYGIYEMKVKETAIKKYCKLNKNHTTPAILQKNIYYEKIYTMKKVFLSNLYFLIK